MFRHCHVYAFYAFYVAFIVNCNLMSYEAAFVNEKKSEITCSLPNWGAGRKCRKDLIKIYYFHAKEM